MGTLLSDTDSKTERVPTEDMEIEGSSARMLSPVVRASYCRRTNNYSASIGDSQNNLFEIVNTASAGVKEKPQPQRSPNDPARRRRMGEKH